MIYIVLAIFVILLGIVSILSLYIGEGEGASFGAEDFDIIEII